MDIIMPKFDHTTEECVITEWCKNVGDSVFKGDILLRVETNKTVLEVISEYTGLLTEIYYAVDDEVPVLTVIAKIE
jgi:Pyruvate/2-oxoglutarate dehydrogenase complex, dihydrolipoamide acyltransferase (E2) component, and related enzymes